MYLIENIREGNLSLYLKISLMINIILLIENISIIIVILIMLIRFDFILIVKMTQDNFLFLLFFSLISIIIIIFLEYYRRSKILFQEKKYFNLFSSYIIITFNIILISKLFPSLFSELKDDISNNYLLLKNILFYQLLYCFLYY